MANWLSLLLGSLLILTLSVGGQTVHRVKEGESLWLIAKRAGVSVDSIRKANGLKSDVIWEGSRLIIPAPQPNPTPAPSPVVPQVKPQSQPEQKPSPVVTPKKVAAPKTRNGLTEKGWEILRKQVLLDRAGYSPGVIDGYDGKYTRLATTLCENWKPKALRTNLPATQRVQVTGAWKSYVNPSLPGSGKAPDFKALTRQPQVIRYYSALEYFAERFHCSEALIQKLNPTVKFSQSVTGTTLTVPNVIPFEIERYFSTQGKGVWSSGVGKSKVERMVYISANDMMLTVWESAKLIRSYPITLNEEDSPRGRRQIGTISPGPHYMRKKTGLELLPGPNSPVGIVWCPLGDGFGIHGTNNPDSIGRATSSGCVRLANWDAVRFAELVQKGATVMVSERERAYQPKG